MMKTLLATLICLLFTIALAAQCPRSITQRNNGNAGGCEFTLTFSGCGAITTGMRIDSMFDAENNIMFRSFTVQSVECNTASNQLQICLAPANPGDNNLGDTNVRIYFANGIVCEYDQFQALPTELISFDVIEKNGVAQATWKVGATSPVAYFEWQRSFDGNRFSPIQVIYPTSATDGSYQATEKLPLLEGTKRQLYYRLVAVDMDGQTTVLATRTLTVSQAVGILTAYPQPVLTGEVVTLNFGLTNTTADYLQTYELVICNSIGLQVQHQKIALANDMPVLQTTGLAAGIYYIQIIKNNELIAQTPLLVYE